MSQKKRIKVRYCCADECMSKPIHSYVVDFVGYYSYVMTCEEHRIDKQQDFPHPWWHHNEEVGDTT